jgi:Uma2 family endonuclease
MTLMEQVLIPAEGDRNEPQRFIFDQADWSLYQHVRETLQDRRVFVTYYKGRLEIVTVSLLHERITALLGIIVRTIAEETDTPIGSAGMATLRRHELDEGAEPDASFYIANEARMRGKEKIDLTIDPPPDLAIEVEVTNRLGARKTIYRDVGVPEIWRFGNGGLTFLIRRGGDYHPIDRSPTFPRFSPHELAGFVTAGIAANETAWTKSFRRRVQELLKGPDSTPFRAT